MKRETLGSRLGFILLSAGCAIGIGNIWKFPYITGQYGGAIFVLIYLFFLVAMGIPLMTMEFAVGRASKKSAAKSFNVLEKPHQKWHLHGFAALAGNIILMMFYTVVAGWMLHYCYLTASGKLEGLGAQEITAEFGKLTADPWLLLLWTAVVVVLGFLICAIGLKNGVEGVTKIMMIALLVLIVVLAVNSVCLDGAAEGLKFYLVPNANSIKEHGLGTVVVAAMNQAFFTLSIGIGSMAIFGSYIGKERALMGEAVRVTVLDTFVALMAGLIIFPACSAYGVAADNGPPLIFITLPNIFANMPLGRLWGTLFFVFMAFAALSTVIAVFENILAIVRDYTGWGRIKASVICCIGMLILSLPCVLGFNVLSGFTPFGEGSNVLDLEDFAVSNVILPLGALVYLLFCVSKKGWGWKKFVKEADTGKGMKVARDVPEGWVKFFRFYLTYILPVIVLIIFAYGVITKFAG